MKSTPYFKTGGGGFGQVSDLALFCGTEQAIGLAPRKPRKNSIAARPPDNVGWLVGIAIETPPNQPMVP